MLTKPRGLGTFGEPISMLAPMNPLRWSFRTLYLLGFLACSGLIAFALYTQYVLGMDPCPLCILQRVAFIGVGLVFLIGALHAPRGYGRQIYSALSVIVAGIGIAIALRHLWIQSLPADQVPSCGAPLGYLLETSGSHGGLVGVLRMVLSGSGECAKVETILGLPMPAWSLIWFVILGCLALWAARNRHA
jgi:disulfide bond formation protein DsbB